MKSVKPWDNVKWITTHLPDKPFIYEPKWGSWIEKEHTELTQLKNRIETLENQGLWEYRKKLVNPYELVYTQDDSKMPPSLAKVKPLSRSYFKMIELLKALNFFKDKPISINSAHVCEGPGGFIQALADLCEKEKVKLNIALAMTLRPTESQIPGWRRAVPFLQKHKEVKIVYGADSTGDIYKEENQASFVASLEGHKAQIFTADGGFDFQLNYTEQEQTSFRLIVSSFSAGFRVLEIGGAIIIKIFDIFGQPTLQLLWFLSLHFKSWTIHKPAMSRPCNSERYFIGKGFIGQTYESYTILRSLQADLEKRSSGTLSSLFNLDFDSEFKKAIQNFQKDAEVQQIQTLKEALELTDTEEIRKEIWKRAYKIGEEWCESFEIPYAFCRTAT